MSGYIQPESVISPKNKWKLTCVLHNGGQNRLSIAKGTWKDETSGQDSEVIGIRYNGYPNNEEGYPVSKCGKRPIWLILPISLKCVLVQEITKSDSKRSYEERA